MIMAGGAGTRLWPFSRAGQPKQLIPFVRRPGSSEAVSLLELAASRLEGVVPPERRCICTGESFRQQIEARLPGFRGERLLGEPMGRDTVNAVGFAAAVLGKRDPGAVFAVLTADHVIEPQAEFARAMDAGFALVEADPTRLVSFAITPTYPATGFGYIEDAGPVANAPAASAGLGFRVARFVEKPPLERAQEYLATGRFFWNAGMFVFHAETFLRLLAKHKPENHRGLMAIREAWGTHRQEEVLHEVYPKLEKISVDYAVMEPASTDPSVTLCGVRMHVNWLDVGSWPSYGETLSPDAQGNRASGATLHAHESRGNVVVSSVENHRIALVGCENLIVVHTPEATLVMPADRAQDLKGLHADLPASLK